jgi:peroxiredoxin (alkyl hydroperoxide reductase subunit C)
LDGNTETRTLKVGDYAPDFTLRDMNLQVWKLADQRGKRVVLNFYPAAFSGVCSQQMPRIEEQKTIFGDDTVIVGISVDGPNANRVFAQQSGISFPLLSDFYPHGKISEEYGVLAPVGVSERAVIGIDKDGKVGYINVHPFTEVPDLTACAVALDKSA